MLTREPPYRISRVLDRFARKIWFSPRIFFPCIWIKKDVDVSKLMVRSKEEGVSLNIYFLKAIALALSKFPRLNYFTFWGRLVWGGPKTRISMICELHDLEECDVVTIESAEKKDVREIAGELGSFIEAKKLPHKKFSIKLWLMNRFPRTMFYFRKWTGICIKDAVKRFGPMVLTNVNHPGADESGTAGVFFSTCIIPQRIRGSIMPLTIAYNHELCNARPFAAFLSCLKDILEDPSKL